MNLGAGREPPRLFGGFAVPFTSAVATLIDVLVLDPDPPAAQARRPVRIRRTA